MDATDQWVKMRKSLGSKRLEISAEQVTTIVNRYGNHERSDASKIFRNVDFGYTTITVERPLQLTWAITHRIRSPTCVSITFNQGCKALMPLGGSNPNFLTFTLVSLAQELESRGQGSTFTELSTSALAAIRVSLPPLDEQRQIAEYLDRETSKGTTRCPSAAPPLCLTRSESR